MPPFRPASRRRAARASTARCQLPTKRSDRFRLCRQPGCSPWGEGGARTLRAASATGSAPRWPPAASAAPPPWPPARSAGQRDGLVCLCVCVCVFVGARLQRVLASARPVTQTAAAACWSFLTSRRHGPASGSMSQGRQARAAAPPAWRTPQQRTCASSTASRGERCSSRASEVSSDCSCSPSPPAWRQRSTARSRLRGGHAPTRPNRRGRERGAVHRCPGVHPRSRQPSVGLPPGRAPPCTRSMPRLSPCPALSLVPPSAHPATRRRRRRCLPAVA